MWVPCDCPCLCPLPLENAPQLRGANDLSVEAFPWRECLQVLARSSMGQGSRGEAIEMRKREWGKSGWQPHSCKEPKNTGSGANKSPNKMNLASLGFQLWFHCFYVPAPVFPKMALHIRHRIEPPPKKIALFGAYQPLVSKKNKALLNWTIISEQGR